MPELPEVETIRRGLLKKVKGKKIKDIEIRVFKLFVGDKKKVIGAKVKNVRRVGKVLEIVLDNGYSILIHLKLTGQLVYLQKSPTLRSESDTKSCRTKIKNQRLKIEDQKFVAGSRSKDKIIVGGHSRKAYSGVLPHKHTHIIYTFSDGSKLYFNDLRKFGWNKVVKKDEVGKILSPENFGPEPGTKKFTVEHLGNVFGRSRKPIKSILMDQKKISGLGNIYSSEALYYAKIKPVRPANKLSDGEIKRLKKTVEKVINLGIKYGGSSENTYVNVERKKGRYMDIAKVYQKKGEECERCGGKIKALKISGRTAFWCPKCQH